jgi:hypothetical protein
MARVNTGKVMHLHVLTTTERNALTATAGMIVFDSTEAKLYIHTGSGWEEVTSA